MIDELLNTEQEYNPTNHSGATYIHTYRQRETQADGFRKPLFRIRGDSKPVNPSVSGDWFFCRSQHFQARTTCVRKLMERALQRRILQTTECSHDTRPRAYHKTLSGEVTMCLSMLRLLRVGEGVRGVEKRRNSILYHTVTSKVLKYDTFYRPCS
jgi:hypothetical protein